MSLYILAASCVLLAGIAIGVAAAVYSLRNVDLTPDEPTAFK